MLSQRTWAAPAHETLVASRCAAGRCSRGWKQRAIPSGPRDTEPLRGNPEDDDVDAQRSARGGSAEGRNAPRARRDRLKRPTACPARPSTRCGQRFETASISGQPRRTATGIRTFARTCAASLRGPAARRIRPDAGSSTPCFARSCGEPAIRCFLVPGRCSVFLGASNDHSRRIRRSSARREP